MNLRVCVVLFCASLLVILAGAAVPAGDDISEYRSCVHCGMDRKAYGFSRMLIHYEDGAAVGVCSLRCAVVEIDSNAGRTVKAILAADRESRALTDAMQAVWVMGGAKRGVMTDRPKWAFATRASAEAFIERYDGAIITWNEALAAAREDLAREVR